MDNLGHTQLHTTVKSKQSNGQLDGGVFWFPLALFPFYTNDKVFFKMHHSRPRCLLCKPTGILNQNIRRIIILSSFKSLMMELTNIYSHPDVWHYYDLLLVENDIQGLLLRFPILKGLRIHSRKLRWDSPSN